MDVKDALKMYEEYESYWSEIYEEAKEDLEFAINGKQWSDTDKKIRDKRPCITVNVLPQFIHQVTNQIRQNTPSINVLPGDKESSKETAKVRKGVIRYIEYRSGADAVYDTAMEYAVTCSIGFIRVINDYVSTDSFEQELIIKRVPNPLNVYIDPSSIECDGSDAEGAVILDDISEDKFKTNYPKKDFVSFERDAPTSHSKKTIKIAEIFVKEYQTIKKQMAEDGSMVDYVDDGKKKKTRTLKKTIIRRYVFSGKELLEESIFPGEYIPIVPVYGRELWVDGKRKLVSLVRGAKDPQRRYNHWASVEAELLSKAPIAPFIAEAGSIEAFAEAWQNPSKEMVLRYNGEVDGRSVPPPQRSQPPMPSSGIINAMQGAYEDIKRSMGLYDASVGNKSNETSGIAIEARQQQGGIATFHFADNLSRAIAQCGRVIDGALPYIYDSERVIQIIGDDESPRFVGINGVAVEGQKEAYDLTKGKYEIRVTTGLPYASKLQEASDKLGRLIEAKPEMIGVFGDIWAKNLDVPYAEAIAERIKRTIPPELLQSDEEGQEEPPTPREMQMNQQMQQMQQQIQAAEAALQEMAQKLADKQGEQQAKEAELTLKVQSEQAKAELEAAKLEIERMKLALEEKKLEIEAFKARSDVMLAMQPKEEVAALPEEEQTPLNPDASDEELLAYMQTRKTSKQIAEEKAQAEKEEEARKEAEEMAMKQAAMQQQQQLAMAIVEALNLNTQATMRQTSVIERGQKMRVVRDANGMLAGAEPLETSIN